MSVVAFHPLAIRPSDDDPDTYVVGRAAGGEFVELPAVGVEAIRLLDSGLPVAEVEERLADGDDRPDVAGLVEALTELGYVSWLDGTEVPATPGARLVEHVRWLKPGHVRWLFGPAAKTAYAALALVALWTIWRRPDLLPGYEDFFWAGTVGVVVLVNTALFVASAVVHELMHLAAARSLGVPARIGFGTRLNNLVLQTDVSAAWAVPRRLRYRIYLAGLYWDTAALCTAVLLVAHADPGPLAEGLLAAYALMILLSLTVQIQVYMRTDFYFVLLDLLRCGDLFHDGLAYARFLAARAAHLLRPRRRPAPVDPARDLPARERRAVRVYSLLLVLGSAVALTVYAFYGIPILVATAVRAGSAVLAAGSGGSLAAAVDGAIVLLVEGALQVVFLVTFYRNRRAWFGRVAARFRVRFRLTAGRR